MSRAPTGHAESKEVFAHMMAFPSPGALEIWNPMLSGLQSWNGAFGKAILALNSEWLGFLNRRMKEDVALPQQLTACKSADEAWHVYVEFLQKAVTDYQHEFAELARLSTSMAGESVDALPQGAAAVAKDLPTRAPRH